MSVALPGNQEQVEARAIAVRRRLGELAGPDPEEDRAFFGALWEAFAGHAPAEIRDLRAALDGAQVEAVEELAHCLKGSAENLGGTVLADYLRVLELAARDGRIDAVAGVGDHVRHEYDVLARAYADVLQDRSWIAAARGSRR